MPRVSAEKARLDSDRIGLKYLGRRVTSGCSAALRARRIADDQLIVRDLKRIGRLRCTGKCRFLCVDGAVATDIGA